MKRIILEIKRGKRALKIAVFLFAFMPFISCISTKMRSQDYTILEKVLSDKSGEIALDNNASNLFIKDLIENHFDNFTDNQKAVMAEMFAEKNIKALSGQINKAKWSQAKVNRYLNSKAITIGDKYSEYAVTKPVFSRDKTKAIVVYRKRGAISLMMFSKNDNDWNVDMFVPIGLR